MKHARLWLLASLIALVAACGPTDTTPPTPTGSVSGVITRTATSPILETASLARGELADIEPGGVFVAFRGGRPEAQLGTTGSAGGFDFRQDGGFSFDGVEFSQTRAYPTSSGLAFYQAPGLDAAATRRLVEQMRASSAVIDAFPNWILTADQVEPDDPLYALQAWHYEQLNLPEAWEIEDGGSERIVVAVLDTGAYEHVDVEWAEVGANFVNWDGAEPAASEGPIDNPLTNPGGSPHGTHVGGTIGAITNNEVGVAGVNWNVELVPVKVLSASGSGNFAGILEGLYWAAGDDADAYDGHVIPEPARVINMSLGGNIGEKCPEVLDLVFQDIYAMAGTIAVVSAGNDSALADPKFPASCPSAITVGATGLTGARAYYSNYGAFVDVFAPGGDDDYDHPVNPALPAGVVSTVDGGYSVMQGTSMASPHVAGVVSLLLAQDPDLTLEEVRARLHNASYPMSASECVAVGVGIGLEGQNLCGAGLLDAAAALLGETVWTTRAFAYAIPYEDEAPVLGLGQLAGVVVGAAYRVEATSESGGDFSFELTELPDGNYLIVGLELRDPDSGIGNIDRVGFAQASVESGGADTVEIVVDPIYLSLF